MGHIFMKQARRAGVALAVTAAVLALGAESAQAQQFTRAELSLDSAGSLQCTFRETGLGSLSQVTYSCGAEALGVVSGCFAKNKFVGPTSVATFTNVAPEETEPLLAKNNGAIGATLTTEVPESEGGHGGCTEPAESRVIAVRWCNAALVDETNGIVGASLGELYAQVERTGTTLITVPACADMVPQ